MHKPKLGEPRERGRVQQRGAVLLLALAVVSLVSLLAVALLWEAQRGQREQTYTRPVWESRRLADFTGELLVGELREEARATAEIIPLIGGEPGEHWLEPRTAQDAALRRDLPRALADVPGLEQVKWVSHRSAANPELAASALPLESVSRGELNAPGLLPADDLLPVDAINWLLVTREGFLPGTEDLQPGMRRSSGSPEEVLGRVAYVIHDLAGRPDAGAFLAQVPEDRLMPADRQEAETDFSYKGRLQAAALEHLMPLPAQPRRAAGGYLTPAGFLDERAGLPVRVSAAGETLAIAPVTWQRLQTLADLREGLPPGTVDVAGQRLFSRRDFLDLAARPETQLPATATARFSSFSRGIMRANVQISGGITDLRPFPLRKLDLLSYQFPTGTADDPERQEAIREFFGLDRASAADPWYYLETAPLGSDHLIRPLAEVLTREPARRPNFFEMLKAALEPGSLGQYAEGTAAREAHVLDRIPDVQILRIGLNLIDQWDRDNFPTRLRIDHSSLSEPLEVAGLENLPLVHKLHFDCINPLWDAEDVAAEDRRLVPYVFPELWNPHQMPASQTPTDGPSEIRLRLVGGVQLGIIAPPVADGPSRPDVEQVLDLSSVSSAVVIGHQELAQFAPLPRLCRSGIPQGLFDNAGLLLTSDSGGPGIHETPVFPGTDFFAARLVPDPQARDLRVAAFSAAPVPRELLSLTHEDRPRLASRAQEAITRKPWNFPRPYKGLVKHDPAGGIKSPDGKYMVSHFYEWLDDERDRAVLRVSFPNSRRCDVVLEYRDHLGHWQVYNRFASGNLASVSDGLGGSLDVRFDIFDGLHLESKPEGEALAARFDRHGAGTFFKSDPRTTRLGVASALNARAGEMPPAFPVDGKADGLSIGRGLRAETYTDRDLIKQAQTGLQVFQNPEFAKFPMFPLPQYFPALLAENLDWSGVSGEQAKFDTFARDPDGLTRPADGWMLRHLVDARHGVNSGSTGNLAWAADRVGFSPSVNQAAMPVILNRPFASLAELGVVFRDQPWKTLDLHSPHSGDGGLLKFFTLAPVPDDAPGPVVRDDVLDLAAADEDTLVALLTGTEIAGAQRVVSWSNSPFADANSPSTRQNAAPSPVPVVHALPAVRLEEQDAREIARRFQAWRKENPDADPGDLLTHFAGMSLGNSQTATVTSPPVFDPAKPASRTILPQPGNPPEVSGGQSTAFSVIDHEREAPMRALADVAQSGTWNLFIDLFVETGFYSATSRNLRDFRTTGRHRQWHRVAIDRHTGRILAWDREPVYHK